MRGKIGLEVSGCVGEEGWGWEWWVCGDILIEVMGMRSW